MTDAGSSKSPPIVQGALGRGVVLPTSRLAIWALSCGALGLIVTPFAIAAIVVGIVAIRRLVTRKGERQGHGIAIAGIATGVIGLILGAMYFFVGWNIFQAIGQERAAAAAHRLIAIHDSAVTYADQNQGYPEHVALLVTNKTQRLSTRLLVADNSSRRRRNWIMVGAYDFIDYDETFKADQAVLAAIEGLDDSIPTYRFGDMNFVRLPRPTDDPGIIHSWYTNPDSSAHTVLFDDGSTGGGLDLVDWSAFRETDAEARKRIGLPAIELPAEP